VLSSCQVLIVSLRNLTESSQKAKFAPPGWKLIAAFRNAPPSLELTTPVQSDAHFLTVCRYVKL